MRMRWLVILAILVFALPAYGNDTKLPMSSHAPMTVEEEDGSPSGVPWKLKVTNDSLTINADGSISLSFGDVIAASNTQTWGSGAAATIPWTYNLTGTDPVLTAESGGFSVGTSAAGNNLSVVATLGSDLSPAYTGDSGVNWTVGAGWETPLAGGVLNANAAGTGTATPTAATAIVAGTTYKVVLTVTVTAGTCSYTLGGVTGSSIATTGTITDYITASTTGNVIFTKVDAFRGTIVATWQALTDATGDLTVDGNLMPRSQILAAAEYGSVLSPQYSFLGASTYGLGSYSTTSMALYYARSARHYFATDTYALLNDDGHIDLGANQDVRLRREAANSLQLGTDAADASATIQTIKAADSTGAGNNGGIMKVSGGTAGAGGTQGAVQISSLGGTATIGGTFTDAKWCSYSTATGMTCNENAPAAAFSVTDITGQTDDSTPATTATAVLAQEGSLVESTLGQIATSIHASPTFTGTATSPTFAASGAVAVSPFSAAGAQFRTVASTITDSSPPGTKAIGAANSFGIPTFASDGNDITVTDAATVYIAGVPVDGGANMALTNVWALYVAAGNSKFVDGITGNVTGNASTASALAADPGNCAAGQIALGVTAAGVAECTATPSGLTSVGATTFTGALTGNADTATSSTNIGITDDTTTNATMYPVWVTANTGNLPAKVTSTKMSFNPSTGMLTVTGVTADSVTVTPTASPATIFTDSDAPGTDKEVGRIVPAYVDGADGAENGTVDYYVHEAGTPTSYIQLDGKNAQVEVNKTLVLGANNLTTTGSVAATGSRATKVWAIDIESTNEPTVGGTALSATTQTLTNKTLTAPLSTLPRVNGSAALSLTAAQVSGTVIRNTGQIVGDVNHTLPEAAAGYNFIAFVGTTLAATNYWRFTANTTPTPDDFMCLDGTCGKLYVSVDTPTMGDTLTCYTEQVSSTGIKTGAALAIGSTTTAVANGAFQYDISGQGYAKAADAVGTAPGNDVIPQNKYGAVAFDIGADGTIDAVEATDNATGYDSAVLAVAGLPAVAAAHTRMGNVTAMKSDGTFTFGTTDLNAANTTVAYTSSTAYTPPFNWICITGKGVWTTN